MRGVSDELEKSVPLSCFDIVHSAALSAFVLLRLRIYIVRTERSEAQHKYVSSTLQDPVVLSMWNINCDRFHEVCKQC